MFIMVIQTESRKKNEKSGAGATASFGLWLKSQKNIVSKYMHDRCLYLQFLTPESIFGVYFALEPSVSAKSQIFGEKLIFPLKA